MQRLLHLQHGQHPQPLLVGLPGMRAPRGNRPIVVEEHAVEFAAARMADLCGLPGRQPLELHRMRRVVDPVARAHAERLVQPIQDHVSTPFDPLDAVGQIDAPEFFGGSIHA